MSASVRIESGIAAGTNYWIDRPVLRIGSDPQCEICLPTADLAAHALTLEFRSGTYRAYNRGSSPLAMGATTLQPGAAGVWNDGDALVLPGDVRLVLAFDGDPRPCPRPETLANDGFDDEPTMADSAAAAVSPEAAKKAKSKTLVQLAIIGVCVAATAGFLLMPSGAEPTPQNQPSFEAIVRASLKQDDRSRLLVQKLQYAQSFLVRGNSVIAKYQFSRLRDKMVREMDSLSEADRKNEQVVLDYVNMRLGQLK